MGLHQTRGDADGGRKHKGARPGLEPGKSNGAPDLLSIWATICRGCGERFVWPAGVDPRSMLTCPSCGALWV
jgi:hypothetical protein